MTHKEMVAILKPIVEAHAPESIPFNIWKQLKQILAALEAEPLAELTGTLYIPGFCYQGVVCAAIGQNTIVLDCDPKGLKDDQPLRILVYLDGVEDA